MPNPTSKKITSLQNPFVKHLVKLREKRAYREKEGVALVCGETIVEELSSRLKPELVLTTLKCELPIDTLHVSDEVMKKITDLSSPPSCAALFKIPKPHNLNNLRKILACDRIADPGNLGTLLRTALALGWEGIYLLNHSVDLFNDKVIRASRGGAFLLPFALGTYDDFSLYIKKNHLTLYVADLEGEDVKSVKREERVALLLGTEGAGQSDRGRALGKKVTIPMEKEMESLNVAVAGSLLMYELMR